MKKSLILATLLFNVANAQDKSFDSITVFDEQDKGLKIQELNGNIKDISELLKSDSRIDISGANPNAQRFYIRGISEALTTISIDGAKQSKDLHQHRGGLISIDTDILKSVNINPGVAPADQGSGNLGGSVEFETVDAQDLLKDKNYGAYIKTNYKTINNSKKSSLALYGKVNENIGLLLYANKGEAKNYKTGDSKEVLGSAEDLKNYLVKLSILDLQNHNLKISHEKNSQEGSYEYGGPGSDFGYVTSIDDLERQKLQRETSIINYNFNPSNKYINTSIKLYKNDNELTYLERDRLIKSEDKGLDLRNTFNFDNNLFSNNLTLGFDFEENEGSDSKSAMVKFENKGFFAQNRMNFDRLHLSFGARFDSFENDLIYKKVDDDELSSNGYLEYFIKNNWSIFTGYGEAVSGANTIPIGWIANIDPNLTFNGSNTANLETQKSKKYEIGTFFETKDILSDSDNLAFNLTLFKTKIEDQITVGSGGRRGKPVSDIVNNEQITSKGFETSITYKKGSYTTSLSYSHSKVKQGDDVIQNTLRREAGNYGDKINANISYKPNDIFNLSYSIIAALKNDDVVADTNNKAGYAIHNISTVYTPKSLKNLDLYFSVNNIFDKAYASHTTLTSNNEAVQEPGRDVRFGLKYTF